MGARGKALAAVGAVTAALVLTGCLAAPSPWTGADDGARVGLVGDSQMYQLEHDTFGDSNMHMTDALVALGYQVSTSDLIGANTADLALIEPPNPGFPTPGAQVSVTVLGVNDMHVNPSTGQPYVSIETAEANYNAWLDALADTGVTCNVVAEIPETIPWGLDETGPTWNAFIDGQANSRNAQVVRWASIVAENPSFVSATDGVHQTSEGKAAFLAAIESAVANCLAAK